LVLKKTIGYCVCLKKELQKNLKKTSFTRRIMSKKNLNKTQVFLALWRSS